MTPKEKTSDAGVYSLAARAREGEGLQVANSAQSAAFSANNPSSAAASVKVNDKLACRKVLRVHVTERAHPDCHCRPEFRLR